MNIFWKIIFSVFFLATALCVGGYFLLNTPRFWTGVATTIIKKNLPEMTIDAMSLDGVKLQLPTAINFSNFQLNVGYHDQHHLVELGQVHIARDTYQKKPSIQVQLEMDDGFYTSSNLKVSGITLDLASTLSPHDYMSLSGTALIHRVTMAELIIRDIQTHIKGNADEVVIVIDDAVFYDGHITGQVTIDPKRKAYYVDLNIKDVNLTQMQQYNQQVFSQVSGIVDGHMVVQGVGGTIEQLTSNFQSSSGAAMKAALMQWYLNYIPENSQQRKLIQQLIKSGGSIPLSSVHMAVSKQDEDTLQATFDLKSRELNLNTNYTVDVNVDGGLNNILFFNQFKSRINP